MVSGNTSKYVEGFESFTADDEMMMNNLKQAVNYTKSNMNISDVNTMRSADLSSSSKSNSLPTKPPVPPQPPVPPIPPASRVIDVTSMPTFGSMPSSMAEPKPGPMAGSMAGPISSTMSNSNSNRNNTRNSTSPNMEDIRLESKLNNLPPPPPNPNSGMVLETEPLVKSPFYDTKTNNSMKNNFKNTTDSDDEDEDDEDDEIEGFRGAEEQESIAVRKILLSLLITFLGYMVIISAMNNLIPIATYTPHLKQFKHLIYGCIFFLITYMCLEVF